ncbi:MAG: hypothetical protein K2X86_06640 [Cytophagaceae bacterium]|nr:hypothetical protein [Cytophagaceae bacterium]
MKILDIIQQIIKEQENSFQPIPVDIRIFNGNILLRSFRIYEVDFAQNTLIGLTLQEEYAHARENREPIDCILKISEIKELICPELDLYYSSEPDMVRA